MEDDDNDESLEAELAALAAGNDTGYKSRRNGKFILYHIFMQKYISIKLELLHIYNI